MIQQPSETLTPVVLDGWCAAVCVQAVPGAGVGVVALSAIRKGERILAETPALESLSVDLLEKRWPDIDAQEAFLRGELADRCTAQQQADVWALHDVSSPKGAVGIFDSNAFATDSERRGMFVLGARLNHSCIPNVYKSWNGSTGRLVFHAIRDVAAGEELCHDYNWERISRHSADVRQERLRQF